MVLKLIVACCKGGGIGFKGALPWSLKHDLRHFKQITTQKENSAIIMGSTTWSSLSKRPLPKRTNLVLSSSAPTHSTSAHFFSSKKQVNEHCLAKKYDEVWIIGGEKVYRQYIDNVDMIYMTKIHKNYDCDTFFPMTNLFLNFTLVDKTLVHNENNIPFQYFTYRRK